MNKQLGAVNAEISKSWADANKTMLWGWKRNSGNLSRTVFYSGNLGISDDAVQIDDHFLYYGHRCEVSDATVLMDYLRQSEANVREAFGSAELTFQKLPNGLANVRMSAGKSTDSSAKLLKKLLSRRARAVESSPEMPPSLDLATRLVHFPADLYVGSGLSYEVGLPTLCDMHIAFGVDNQEGTDFAFGLEDTLPKRLASNLDATIKDFASVHFGALAASPSNAMKSIAALKKEGAVGKVFSDNVDNMLAKVGVEFERTRGSGVLNEEYPAKFENDTLIVIGVAADRRRLIKKARSKGMKIVVVNPCMKVSPKVRHLDYFERDQDAFFKHSAEEFFSFQSA